MTINDILERYPIEILDHVGRVMDMVMPFGKDYMTVALLHDILEDTDIIMDDLINCHIDYDIIDDVFVLTRRLNETYFEYIDRITKSTRRAKIIKYYDILDHLYNKETLKDSLEKRYLKAKEILKKALDI